jgi:hypothetical protein
VGYGIGIATPYVMKNPSVGYVKLKRGAPLRRILLPFVLLISYAAIPAAASSVNVTLVAASSVIQGGVTVAPYYLSINGGPDIPVVCDDYTHDVFITESWTATINSFSTLASARFGLGAFQQYAEAGWLATQMFARPSQDGNLNFAIWALFAPIQTETNARGWTTGAQNWYIAALAWFGSHCSKVTDTCNGINLANFEIITPTSNTLGSPQEYIVMTPEPTTIALFGVGMLFLAMIGRKVQVSHSGRAAH